MTNIAGYTPTGRRLKGPASDIVELTRDDGEMLSAIVFHPEYHSHPAINEALDVVARFLEDPMVHDLVELVGRDPSQGAFVYDTGPTWAVADIIRILADLGETAGSRAGLELMLRAGKVLNEAASFGASENVYSHGGLTPWRMVLRQDGRVMIIGHALPQVEILMFHEDHTVLPPSDSFRYCPPERIHGEEEDLSSDLFSLSLVIFEFITGKPVYDGLVNDIRQQAARGDAGSVLFRARASLPASVRDILGNAMRLEMHDRYESGDAFLEAVEAALHSGDVVGPSLADVMRKVSSQMQRRGVVPDAASTVMGTAEEIRAMLGDDDDEPDDAPKREAWKPASSSKRASSLRQSGARRPVRSRSRDDSAEALESAPSVTDRPSAAEAARSSRVSGVRRKPRRTARAEAPPSPEPQEEPPNESAPVDVAKVLRSSRIRKPRRNRRAPVEPPPSEAIASPSDAPPIAESLGQPEAPAAVTSTADLLAQIRQSATRSRRSSVDRPSAAKQKIEALVRSGERPAESSATGDESPPAEASPVKGRRTRAPRRVRRGASTDASKAASDVAPADAPAPAEKEASAPEAERVPAAGSESVVPPSDDTSSSPPDAAAAASEPAESAPATPSEKPARGRAKRAARTKSATKTAANHPDQKVQAPSVGDFKRPPAPMPPGSPSKKGIPLVFRREPDGKGTRMRLPEKHTVAEAVSWLVGNVIPVRTDLTGRLTGWYRLSNSQGRIAPETSLSSLDPEEPLIIETVLNGSRLVDLSVVGARPHRFVTPVGTAVPVISLVDHITRLLGLPDGRYELHGPDGALAPHSILDDLEDDREVLPLALKPLDPEGAA